MDFGGLIFILLVVAAGVGVYFYRKNNPNSGGDPTNPPDSGAA